MSKELVSFKGSIYAVKTKHLRAFLNDAMQGRSGSFDAVRGAKRLGFVTADVTDLTKREAEHVLARIKEGPAGSD